MTDPRYLPRKCCVPSTAFGTAGVTKWIQSDTMSVFARDQLDAAKIQHHYSRRVREELASQKRSLVEYAELSGMDYTRLGRLLRGDIVMRLEDLANTRRTLTLLVRRRAVSPPA